MPVSMAVLLLFIGVWLAAHILQNITTTLTAMTAGDTVQHTAAVWPVR